MWYIFRRKEPAVLCLIIASAALVAITFNKSSSGFTLEDIDTLHELQGVLDDLAQKCRLCEVFVERSAEEYECIEMKYDPPPTICLYDDVMDKPVSGRIRRTGAWEDKYVTAMLSWLQESPHVGFIDIGANIGVFSLVAASKGNDVISVEPNIENARRLRASVELSGFQNRITILHNAVGDERGVAKVIFFRSNQGLTKVEMVNSSTDHNLQLKTSKMDSDRNENQKNLSEAELYAKTIFLDDIVEFCRFQEAVMKIDIEGFEPLAFQKASVLFDKIRIFKIMMEWVHIQTLIEEGSDKDKRMVEDLINFFINRRYRPVDWDMNGLDLEDVATWPSDIIWSLD